MNAILSSVAAALATAVLSVPSTVAQISASYSPRTGELTVVGDSTDNTINISRTDNGDILINNGEVAVLGATVDNTILIRVVAGDGDDSVLFDETNGPLPSADVFGGPGADVITTGDNDDVVRGGDGNDIIVGGKGADVLLGEDGNDLIVVNEGDAVDFIEGGNGVDFVQVNGADGGDDHFSIQPNGQRVHFERSNLERFTLDIGTTENLDVNGQGGSDVIIGSVGLNGLISLDLDGGEGNDLLIGGDGADVIRGGIGSDFLVGSTGNDTIEGQDGSDLLIWNNGDGSDFMEGGDGIDTVQIVGSDSDDNISVNPQRTRVHVQLDASGNLTLDVGTTETFNVDGARGDDNIVVVYDPRTGDMGAALNVEFDGGEGNDLLIGSDGADVLRGGKGADVLLGGNGHDYADGGPGRDEAIDCERTVNVEIGGVQTTPYAKAK